MIYREERSAAEPHRNSEYLPQRRKGRKSSEIEGEIIIRVFYHFPITFGAFAAWREKFPRPDYLRGARKFLNYSNTKHAKNMVETCCSRGRAGVDP